MTRISRREFLGYSRWAVVTTAAGGSILAGRPGRAVAQPLTKVRFTLPWVAEGSLIHTFIARKDRKSTRLNSSHSQISYAVFCLKKKKKTKTTPPFSPPTHKRCSHPRDTALPCVQRY